MRNTACLRCPCCSHHQKTRPCTVALEGKKIVNRSCPTELGCGTSRSSALPAWPACAASERNHHTSRARAEGEVERSRDDDPSSWMVEQLCIQPGPSTLRKDPHNLRQLPEYPFVHDESMLTGKKIDHTMMIKGVGMWNSTMHIVSILAQLPGSALSSRSCRRKARP